ncbi:MAG: ECF-type sigma factor [Planctomycetaceae bacterium]|nr:ECF-type sigma factor [Planctomycetaceae bacterium]
MSPEGSVTGHLGKLKAGDQSAARLLWQRYFRQLVRLARRKLPFHARRAADEEDVALAAFAKFCQGAEEGRLPKVRNREDVWKVLVTLTVRMAIDQVRGEGRQKRGGAAPGKLPPAAGPARDANPEHVASRQATPEFVAQVAEECNRLLGALGDEELKAIAVWKTEGYTNEDIASELGYVLRTVERKVQAIRRHWSEDDPAGGAKTRGRR